MNTDQVLEQMRSRNRVDSLFPALRHGQLCQSCHSRRVEHNGRTCVRCEEIAHDEDYPQQEEE